MNINAAKKLLEKYKSLTLEQLEETFELLKERPYKCTGSDVMEVITGFGSCETCGLCLEAKELTPKGLDFCECCIYKFNFDDFPYCLGELYNNISDASNAEMLYLAIQDRIKYLEETIKIYELIKYINYER